MSVEASTRAIEKDIVTDFSKPMSYGGYLDLEENFQLWRFRHMRTVLRTIGMKSGTGGSSGVGFLRKALELTFFPELLAVRTETGR